MRKLWVSEVWMSQQKHWEPMSVAFTADRGKKETAAWQKRFPRQHFRLVCYIPKETA